MRKLIMHLISFGSKDQQRVISERSNWSPRIGGVEIGKRKEGFEMKKACRYIKWGSRDREASKA
ncbi:hypothetical protein DVH24_027975 [Malus domestica]|uniref:Uncharacterized protein n=1 Tax=Malus domestica TaxID=3750 RepID=A0A498H8U2_MALDO|nr:hypothetical protein DVH24_027975 [Malus domestica]